MTVGVMLLAHQSKTHNGGVLTVVIKVEDLSVVNFHNYARDLGIPSVFFKSKKFHQ